MIKGYAEGQKYSIKVEVLIDGYVVR